MSGHSYQESAAVDSSVHSPAARAPGKRTLTDRLPAGATRRETASTAGGAPGGPGPTETSAAFRPDLELEPSEVDDLSRAFTSLLQMVKALKEQLGGAADKAKHAGPLAEPVVNAMKQIVAVLKPLAEKLEVIDLVQRFMIATVRWGQAFDAYQASRSRTNAVRLQQANEAWCDVAMEGAHHFPKPVAAEVELGVRALRATVEVAIRVGTQSLSVTRSEQAEAHDVPAEPTPEAAPPTPAPRAPACTDPDAFAAAFERAVVAHPEASERLDLPAVRAAIAQWRLARRVVSSDHRPWKVGPLAPSAENQARNTDRAEAARAQLEEALWAFRVRVPELPATE